MQRKPAVPASGQDRLRGTARPTPPPYHRIGRACKPAPIERPDLELPVNFGVLKGMRLSTIAAVASLVGFLAVESSAQQPRFDVASIKPSEGGSSSALLDPLPSGYNASNVPLSSLIRLAYGLNPYQVVGGPDWAYRDRFTVAAKYPAGWSLDRPGGRAEALQMLQTLLADRFALRVHNDTREGTVYLMTMARDDRRPGPRLRPAPACVRSPSREAREKGAIPCTATLGRQAVEMNGQPVPYFASSVALMIGAPIIDRTGLSGFYDIKIEWTPAQTPDAGTDYVPLFIAIEEQLGLKLQRSKGPIDVLVIDSAQRPTPD